MMGVGSELSKAVVKRDDTQDGMPAHQRLRTWFDGALSFMGGRQRLGCRGNHLVYLISASYHGIGGCH